ncbi:MULTISPECIES: MutS-related protein [Ruminococcus]|uniref:MutS domain V n=1 Tax=Ruminococcus flavefaciens TaxID=1265 RepID=A0A1M7MJQ2_RUMFL|nr:MULTISPECIES: DNA mismatch repair protein [Ruminococcus]MCR4795106.1 DNA mismatch repair protein [Ruminococcus sp.]SHM91193.1 MutS domain V [Ruminococcus flavefaciens]
MRSNNHFSILFPYYEDTEYKQLSESACHDLGLDTLCRELSNDPKEQNIIMNIISNMTNDPRVAAYRQKVFVDILGFPKLRKQLSELFERIEFLRKFSGSNIQTDEKLGFWHLMHRLDELDDYIKCVEAMRECLSDKEIKSEGLQGFKEYIDELYNDACFAEMKKDIAELKIKSLNIQSVTLGVNVNSRFEAVSMGLVSINDKPFKKSNIVTNFADAIASKSKIQEGNEWDGDMHYHQVDKLNEHKISNFIQKAGGYLAVTNTPFIDGRIRATVTKTPDGDGSANATCYLDKVINKMLDSLVKKLRDTFSKYADIAIVNISQIIPEFMYYIMFAEFIERSMEKGFRFCEAQLIDGENVSMDARGLYNLKLAVNMQNVDDIVYNDLVFDKEHTIYILTGANRGGKTTITQAVGLMYVLAQGGIYVPASSFEYKPVDCVYTHFPADEDKTMDLGRLGEECVRFKAIYSECTKDSLLLLNETFSTTSFEEGFYIANDSVRALLSKQVKTIYNTHMHKLAADVDELNKGNSGVKASSLIMKSDNGKRSFKVEVASPEGLSYAKDIAEKYGVTYEMLVK